MILSPIALQTNAFRHCLGLLETAALPRAGFLCFFPAISLGMPFKHTFGAGFWARAFVATLSHSKTLLRLLYKRTLLTVPWTPRNGSPSILCCDWLKLLKQIILVCSSLVQFLGCGPAISWVCCPKKSQLSSSCNKQISKSAYYSLCSRDQL